MRYASVAICLFALCLATVAEANSNFTVPLHAGLEGASCTSAASVTCELGNPAGAPRVNIAPGEAFRLFILVNNYTELQAFQTALVWPADWTVNPDGVQSPCTAGTFVAHDPVAPGGPTDGTYAAAFNCITGPAVARIHRVDFIAGATGCISQTNPTQGSGFVEIDDCATDPPGGNPTYIDANTGQNRLGKICVGAGGFDACRGPVPVEAATWGKIKNTYK